MNYKIPRSVLVLIHTADLDVLLIERADRPGFWQSVTGSVDREDEPLEAAALREVREETGIDASRHPLEDWRIENSYEIFQRWRGRYPPGVTHNRERVFGLRLPRREQVVLAPREHLRYCWLPCNEAVGRVFSWSNADAIRLLALRR